MTAQLLSKQQALADHLGIPINDVIPDVNGNVWYVHGDEYLVVNDRQANKFVAEEIENSLWAFNAEFIARHTKAKLSDHAITAIKKMQEELCEDANEIVKALIPNMSAFIQDAIDSDGRGHFLSKYDGKEIELKGGLFAYKN